MQPTLRQVPPKVPDSMIATRLPSKSGVTSELPEPVPMIARSKSATASAYCRQAARTGMAACPVCGACRPRHCSAGPVDWIALSQQHDQLLLRADPELAEHRGQV